MFLIYIGELQSLISATFDRLDIQDFDIPELAQSDLGTSECIGERFCVDARDRIWCRVVIRPSPVAEPVTFNACIYLTEPPETAHIALGPVLYRFDKSQAEADHELEEFLLSQARRRLYGRRR